MNITITINNDEIKVKNNENHEVQEVIENNYQQETSKKKKENQITVTRNRLTKLPNSKYEPVVVEEFELANYLLSLGFLIKEIVPDETYGFKFLFFPGYNISRTIKKWTKNINTLQPESEVVEDGREN